MRQIELQAFDRKRIKLEKKLRKILPDLKRVSLSFNYYSGQNNSNVPEITAYIWDTNDDIVYSIHGRPYNTTANALFAEFRELIQPEVNKPAELPDLDDELPF